VDLAMFTTLSDDDLKSIGVTAYRPRKLMLHAISGDLVEFKKIISSGFLKLLFFKILFTFLMFLFLFLRTEELAN
jgi:hypothetical protein